MGWITQNWIWLALGIVVLFIMRRAGLGHFAGDHAGYRSGGQGMQPDRGAPPTAPTTTIDPVNGQPIRADRAQTTLYRGAIYYFASSKNRDRFEAAPQEYAHKAVGQRTRRAATADSGRQHGC